MTPPWLSLITVESLLYGMKTPSAEKENQSLENPAQLPPN